MELSVILRPSPRVCAGFLLRVTGGDNVTQSLHMLARLRYRKLRDKLGASPETDFISDCGTLSCKPLTSFACQVASALCAVFEGISRQSTLTVHHLSESSRLLLL